MPLGIAAWLSFETYHPLQNHDSSQWNFPLSTLTEQSERLHGALTDTAYQAAMAERLDTETDTATDNFAMRFDALLTSVKGGGSRKAGKTGDISDLTLEQKEFLSELQRLTAGARRSARLAFPGQDALLGSEFKVGIDEPRDLASQLDRAEVIAASCGKRAPALKDKGWTAKDTHALQTVIDDLGGTSLDQEDALDAGIGITEERVVAANLLYDLALAVQNAARLEYPDPSRRRKLSAEQKGFLETARRRFLLDEFPPRDRSQPDGGTGTAPSGPTTPPK